MNIPSEERGLSISSVLTHFCIESLTIHVQILLQIEITCSKGNITGLCSLRTNQIHTSLSFGMFLFLAATQCSVPVFKPLVHDLLSRKPEGQLLFIRWLESSCSPCFYGHFTVLYDRQCWRGLPISWYSMIAEWWLKPSNRRRLYSTICLKWQAYTGIVKSSHLLPATCLSDILDPNFCNDLCQFLCVNSTIASNIFLAPLVYIHGTDWNQR